MRTSVLRMVVLTFVLTPGLVGCGRGAPPPPPGPRARPPSPPPAKGAFSLTSAAFQNNAPIPAQYTADGQGISPSLQWTAPPAGTKSMALIVSDPDAPGATYIHWVLYGIPAAARSLPGSVPKNDTLPQLAGIRQGTNSAGSIGWTPPSPPPGKVHHYEFRLYALDAAMDLAPRATAPEAEKAMKGHVLATAELTGTYRR